MYIYSLQFVATVRLTYIITSTLKHVAADTHLGKERENLTWKLWHESTGEVHGWKEERKTDELNWNWNIMWKLPESSYPIYLGSYKWYNQHWKTGNSNLPRFKTGLRSLLFNNCWQIQCHCSQLLKKNSLTHIRTTSFYLKVIITVFTCSMIGLRTRPLSDENMPKSPYVSIAPVNTNTSKVWLDKSQTERIDPLAMQTLGRLSSIFLYFL